MLKKFILFLFVISNFFLYWCFDKQNVEISNTWDNQEQPFTGQIIQTGDFSTWDGQDDLIRLLQDLTEE